MRIPTGGGGWRVGIPIRGGGRRTVPLLDLSLDIDRRSSGEREQRQDRNDDGGGKDHVWRCRRRRIRECLLQDWWGISASYYQPFIEFQHWVRFHTAFGKPGGVSGAEHLKRGDSELLAREPSDRWTGSDLHTSGSDREKRNGKASDPSNSCWVES